MFRDQGEDWRSTQSCVAHKHEQQELLKAKSTLGLQTPFFPRSFQFLNYTFSLLLNYIHMFSSWTSIAHTFEPVSWGAWQQRKVTGSCLWYRTSESAFEMQQWECITEIHMYKCVQFLGLPRFSSNQNILSMSSKHMEETYQENKHWKAEINSKRFRLKLKAWQLLELHGTKNCFVLPSTFKECESKVLLK